ncbi:glycolate oxidase iron-sulfur subunit [Alicyclobacillus hesperidum subsp. aegles]|uniref:(Fe-S)-binding protein n=1 Tax=Alicyclobacillus hesperidum TaxID=89784 RepID=UPI00222CD026|nr:(Fe-S)-binding protein [Alicyclobacillus hesperidum]GLG02298.1 glycolate oxidase iron-sulfur subunit [Alicyclobacillus hesperidum subsp. aegles]
MVKDSSSMAPRLSDFCYPDAPEEDKYSVCVHCGFCLEVCPTYQAWGDENHSPRGRVFLIKSCAEGELPLDESVIDPVFTCLDCRACETVCPSGVQVGALVEEARGQVFHARREHGESDPLMRLFLRGIFPRPGRLKTIRRLMRFYQKSGLRSLARSTGVMRVLPPQVREMEDVIPEIGRGPAMDVLPPVIAPKGERKATAALFTGCVMDVFFSDVNEATARVMVRNGVEVHVPREQICCGALQVHAGDRDMAREMAKKNIEVFERAGADYIAINAAGCGAALKEYPELFHDDPAWHERAVKFSARVRDITQLLVEVGFDPPKAELPMSITYHDACHLCHAQKIRREPRSLLTSVPGVDLREMPDSDRCCGSAGIYNLTHPDMAGELLERKMDDVPPGVEAIVMGNPGCMMQIRLGVKKRNQQLRVMHTVEVLDLAYQREETP